uniref:Acetyl-CoA carboxylase n=1 Tax=Neobodo designis TaxID=312471 RepID=A0A7S1LQM5_NEODS|mmetsp:Transcript_26316/g.81277  ORF Transcript_26316/g.81277 Transcript_26316/m.81277 type:complete len:2210 (+) Transcript_26316:231-6860(+)|eukprot:CAMPEP_0174844842 /NCGR_PEP_ID=MMETSP1114-20130205/11354_1 /TAXON_ID=312471 /ORGANISM="Neobodo designis, Strain CCAP 1951/1" /LENGTH=2209 /DNA_ID=CAMNT_0016079087 /DNA_START=228 /DNA_END=6857 /DNA_ORIENTATION=+
MAQPTGTQPVTTAHFANVDALFKALGGPNTPKDPIRRVLVANNGLAAVKGIRSIQQWLFDHVGDHDAIKFEVMATPEDLGANAEFIRMAHHHTEVPGGSNANNYANVDLIVETALRQNCDAVYPGWGHASENPKLPRMCVETKKVRFLGPHEKAMFALGDKIASSIIAQSLDVPTVPWSGDSLRVPRGTLNIDDEVYRQAFVDTAEECVEVVKRVGFPVMLKASEGGGGKGIRKVYDMADVIPMFEAVKEEVKGCHIFVMRMLTNVRHLEVQLLADSYGDCIAVRTRDCSVQRRHQKIIEEGPVVGVDPGIVTHMEQAAIRLAKAVGYVGLGTVEYMYDKDTHTYCFLELNPRIQVEHPVSELISNVNLPAALLCVGLGVPLHRIPEVRAYYGEDPYTTTPIDFDNRQANPARGHAIAVRVTAEDTENGFRPTCGSVDDISFRDSRDCWGYFSVASGGSIHQFADSQFGHIFATGNNREEARRSMALALRNLSIRGEIRTSSAYVLELLETREFRECDCNTAWLDGLIQSRPPKPKQDDVHPALAAASIYRMITGVNTNASRFTSFLKAGHTPATDYLLASRTETFVLAGEKYVVEVGRTAPGEFCLVLNDDVLPVTCREMSLGALQMTIGGRNVVAYLEEEGTNLRVIINGRSLVFTGDADPTKLRSSVTGRLVRFLIPDGGHVSEGQAYCEVEVMKMILRLNSGVTGTMTIRAAAGSTLANGKLLAEVEPDDPSKVARAVLDTKPWPAPMHAAAGGTNATGIESLDAVARARAAIDTLASLVSGFHFERAVPLQKRLSQAFDGLSSLSLSSVNLASLNRPFVVVEGEGPSTPISKLHAVFAAVVRAFLEIERHYDGKTREAALAALRDANEEGDLRAVFDIDFAHNQPHRLEVVRAVLQFIDRGDEALMRACRDLLEPLAALSSTSAYGPVLLQARYLQRKAAVPRFEERKDELVRTIEQQAVSDIATTTISTSLLTAVLFDRRNTHLVPPVLEIIARRCYYGEGNVSDVDVVKGDGVQHAHWTATWRVAGSDAPAPLHIRQPSGSPTKSHASSGDAAQSVPGVVSLGANSLGMLAVFNDERGLALMPLGSFLEAATVRAAASPEHSTMLYVFFQSRTEDSGDKIAASCAAALQPFAQKLAESAVDRVTFCAASPDGDEPGIYTFSRKAAGFTVEESLFRDVFPTIANRLELGRLRNYDVSMFPTPHRKVHVYVARPKGAAPARGTHKRMFVRTYVTPGDLGIAPWTALGDADCASIVQMVASAVELAQSDRKAVGDTVYNHLFVNLVELTLDLKSVPHLFRELARTYAKTMYSVGFREVEIKFVAKRSAAAGEGVPFRAFITNHTMHSLSLESYVEVTDEHGHVGLHRARFADDIGNVVVAGSPQERRTWGGKTGTSSFDLTEAEKQASHVDPEQQGAEEPVDPRWKALRDLLPDRVAEPFSTTDSSAPEQSTDAYPLLTATQLRRLQAQASGTTYAYDWLTLIEVVVRRQWRALVSARKLDKAFVPEMPVDVKQLFYDEATQTVKDPKTFTPTAAAQGAGMLVWVLTLRTAADFDFEAKTARARRAVLVANDITTQFGSFSVTEDLVFKAASALARADGVPFLYLSANSGARLGLVNDVKQCFRVAESNGSVDYLYLTPDDYKRLNDSNVKVTCEAVTVDGETRMKIVDVIGSPNEHIGVENLQGSALIAGEMSLNYATVPTMSVVSGRSVGIGAYLVRLGRRVVQTSNSPIILTGAPAINKLLGKEVYSSNQQLGGTEIMLPNGVSHFHARDDLDAVRTALRWLDLMPHTVASASAAVPRLVSQPAADPVDRDVTFVPAKAAPYDPRALVAGDAATGTLGMFDAGSWVESLSDWAKTVVVGRATLGGIPAGVIIVETRSVRKYDPADPADPESSAAVLAQAGQVWFPDSARKTADALDDFHHERLPCFILANWRGFSGGMRDMFDEVLKFGASIVDNLRVYDRPVFIYIPPFGELRGGAWVVVDPVINHQGCVTMYADPNARGGILEPAGMVEIKFREADVLACMRRNHPDLVALAKSDPTAAKKKEEQLKALYTDVAVKFADLHDTPGRMAAKSCVSAVVPWAQSRRFFHALLRRKLAELSLAETLAKAVAAPGATAALVDGIEELKKVAAAAGVAWADDKVFTAWATSDAAGAAVRQAAAVARAKSAAAGLTADGADITAACKALLEAGGADLKAAMARALQ